VAGTMEAEGGEAAKEEPVRADGMPLTLALARRCQNISAVAKTAGAELALRWRCAGAALALRWRCQSISAVAKSAGAALALPKYICRCQNRWRSAGAALRAALALRWRYAALADIGVECVPTGLNPAARFIKAK